MFVVGHVCKSLRSSVPPGSCSPKETTKLLLNKSQLPCPTAQTMPRKQNRKSRSIVFEKMPPHRRQSQNVPKLSWPQFERKLLWNADATEECGCVLCSRSVTRFRCPNAPKQPCAAHTDSLRLPSNLSLVSCRILLEILLSALSVLSWRPRWTTLHLHVSGHGPSPPRSVPWKP